MAKNIAKGSKVVYPPGCKELTEELGKDELIKRLKLLARAFQDMGQDDNEQYSSLALYIASDFFMDHPSKDVRLLIACCIADVFRIFAPEAPYRDQDHLKEIFKFLIQQLRGLEDPDSPSFRRYFYLLENLAWVKSFNICLELDDNQEIFCALFKLMFSIVSDKHSSKVKNFMLDMMTPLIVEADSVSQELLDVILMNMVEPRRGHNKVAYGMAKDLLRRTSNAIEPYVNAFFNNMLMLGKTSESEVSNHLYELIYELNQVSPSILFAVLPQLEFKLKSNEEHERKNVTKLLAKMFSEQGSDLALKNKPLWVCFLGRFNDISISVRTICVQYAQHFILNHPELVKDILEQMKVRQHDPEETVRMEVVNCMLQVAKRDFSVVTDEMLVFIRERTLDKKFKIRREALLGLGNIYKTVMSKDPVDPQEAARVDWIRNKVFHHYYQNSNDDRLLVERILNIHLVPYTLSVEERMRKLLELYCSLDDNAVKAFTEMLKHRNNVRQVLHQLIDAHEKQDQPNPPPIIPRLSALARTLPEQQKPHDYIKKLNISLRDDRRMRYLFKTLVGTDCSCKRAEDTVKEVLKKVGCPPGQNTFYYNLVKSLLERVAPVMIDSSAVLHLVKLVDELITGRGPLADLVDNAPSKGIKLLLTLSFAYPHCFRSKEVYEAFLTFLKHDDDVVCKFILYFFLSHGSGLEEQHPTVYMSLLPVLINLAKMGTPKQTKHAIRCINIICRNKEPILTQVFEHVQKSLNPDSANYITSIVALGHIAQLCPQTFATEMKNIVTKIIVKDLLMQDRTSGPPTEDGWYADHLVTEETQAKVQAMKLLVRWLLGLKNNTNNSGTSTLRLLYTVIIHEGDLMEQGRINKPELARLRLQAGCCMMKLAEEPCFGDIITREQFQALALLINDTCYHVRLQFALKLHKGLLSLRLPLEYMSIFSLAANDPLKERRLQLRQFLATNVQKRRDYLRQNPNARGLTASILPDYVVPYTIHLLAHDPDFKTYDHVESLKNLKECLWFILEPLVKRAEDYNYAFLRRLIEKIKQTKDAQGPDDEEMNKKLYAVCDLALGLMNIRVSNVTLKDSNAEPLLPSKLFTAADKSFKNLQSYLPKDFPLDARQHRGFIGFGGKTQTTTEIIVMSHAPIVNPLPKSPRVSRRREREPQQHAESGQDSDANDSRDTSNSESPKPGGTQSQDSEKITRSKRLGKAEEIGGRRTSGSKGEDSSDSASEAKTVKTGTKQTKLEDFSSKTKSGGADKDSVVNGSSKTVGRRTGRSGAGGSSHSGPVEGDSKAATSEQNRPSTRKRRASGEDGGGAGKRGRGTESEKKQQAVMKKPTAGSTSTAEVFDPAETPTSQDAATFSRTAPRKRAPSPSSSPPQQHTVPVKKTRLTRGDLKNSEESETQKSSGTESPHEVPSPPDLEAAKASSRKGIQPAAAHASTSTASAPSSARNIRRGRPLSNGTSDGEDHSTQDTDSQGSSASSKLAALTRAIELVPAVKATAPSKEEEEEEDDDTLQVKRRMRPRKK
ncbi:sister chromatid cohesion protein PDS5 homolog A-like [Pomacea canaliculata]|uniref:sister chromatid cohesion protein PDS5 homolog A-like n=1 Tax=Pomacea canaliculata TaxID=400727 RepID=UPI000D738121|nr:sister chromatid cohesion protein PDS5 homolog A-like [Pomacea canaliculata]